jgi:hypothetical protein
MRVFRVPFRHARTRTKFGSTLTNVREEEACGEDGRVALRRRAARP